MGGYKRDCKELQLISQDEREIRARINEDPVFYNLLQGMFASSCSKKSSIKSANFSNGYSARQDLQLNFTYRQDFSKNSSPPHAKQYAAFFSICHLRYKVLDDLLHSPFIMQIDNIGLICQMKLIKKLSDQCTFSFYGTSNKQEMSIWKNYW